MAGSGLPAGVVVAGFFGNPAVQVALTIGGVVALVSGVVGTFTVIRGQSFAGHSLSDIGSAGGSASFLVGISPLYGFVAMNVLAAGAMEMIGIRRPRGRDLATGIVLGAALGLAALFLYLDTTSTSATGATVSVLFGSIFTIPSSTIPAVAGFSLLSLGLVLLLYRPLLLSSLSTDLAASRGVPVRLVGAGYLLALAVAVSLSAITIGAILSTALLVGPAATALRLSRRPGAAAVMAALLGIAATWLGVWLSYDSYDWSSSYRGWPVSFFIVVIVIAFYGLSHLPWRRLSRLGRRGGLVGAAGAG